VLGVIFSSDWPDPIDFAEPAPPADHLIDGDQDACAFAVETNQVGRVLFELVAEDRR
jgi:hypothetical protein